MNFYSNYLLLLYGQVHQYLVVHTLELSLLFMVFLAFTIHLLHSLLKELCYTHYVLSCFHHFLTVNSSELEMVLYVD